MFVRIQVWGASRAVLHGEAQVQTWKLDLADNRAALRVTRRIPDEYMREIVKAKHKVAYAGQ